MASRSISVENLSESSEEVAQHVACGRAKMMQKDLCNVSAKTHIGFELLPDVVLYIHRFAAQVDECRDLISSGVEALGGSLLDCLVNNAGDIP